MTTTQRRTDHELSELIAAELSWSPNIEADRIGVAISDGAVTLSGQVLTYPEKHAAVRAVFRVRGVNAVADEIEVYNDSGPRQDADIAREASDALERSAQALAGSVKAEVQDQFVTLTGSVAWHYQREAIQQTIVGLRGVHGVRNDIVLEPTVVMPNEARIMIADALRRNAELDAGHIQVHVTGTRIALTGRVSSWAEQRQASAAAWATPGVTHVDNDLRVVR